MAHQYRFYVWLEAVNGRPAISYSDDNTQRLLYVRANDADGSSWPAAPIVIDSGPGTQG